MTPRRASYAEVTLTTDLGALTDNERRMLPLLIEACREMDAIFWLQAYGDRQPLLASISDPELRRYVEINYGPWDRLDANKPFLEGVGAKPAGAGFYPTDMTDAQFQEAVKAAPDGGAALKSLYTVVRRDPAGKLVTVPYREAYAPQVARASSLLLEAAKLADDPGLKRYLELRARALLTDDYRPSDFAWMEMKNNVVDVVIGPIETYEDQLYGIRAAHEGYVLVKDRAWSRKLERYAQLLPALQRGLPVPDDYKKETPGTESDLNAYDAVFYAGDCNAGSKTIAINLPNDEEVQLKKGTRRLQLKNAMQAKFEKILVPISERVIVADQRKHVTFDAFFSNVMFHEVAHGLGIKQTVGGSGFVREVLKEQYGALEEGKADVLGLYMVKKLREMGELQGGELADNYVTFVAGLFRSVRFGASSAHGRANLAQFEFLEKEGAFTRGADGAYRVDFEKMGAAVDRLAEKILRLQGDGDYEGSLAFLPKGAQPTGSLKATLDAVNASDVPTDVVFRQGMDVLNK
ncbi:MAG TPA: hypothetical protein VF139_12055 [Candidatus Polarisedimenticolaceae bacterium]